MVRRASPRSASRHRRTPRLAQLGFLVVAGFLLVNKVYSPQYVLWLLPLAVLARPRWRDQIVWQAAEVFYFMSVWWYLGGYLAPAVGDDVGAYWVAIVVRMLGELYLVGGRARHPAAGARPGAAMVARRRRASRLVVLVTRDILRPAHDPVRSPRRQLIETRSNAVAV